MTPVLTTPRFATPVAAMLGRIKLRVTVDSRPFREVFPKIGKRQTDFYLFGWFSSTFDAQTNFLNLVRSDAPFNATGYANPRVDSLIDTIGAEISTYVRDAMIEEVWRIVRNDIVHVPLHQQPLAWAMWDRAGAADRRPRRSQVPLGEAREPVLQHEPLIAPQRL